MRTRRQFKLRSTIRLSIEAPGVDWTVDTEAQVVFAREGFVGLEFTEFESKVLPRLDELGDDAERLSEPSPNAKSAVGEAQVHFTEEDEIATGEDPLRRHKAPQVLSGGATTIDDPSELLNQIAQPQVGALSDLGNLDGFDDGESAEEPRKLQDSGAFDEEDFDIPTQRLKVPDSIRQLASNLDDDPTTEEDPLGELAVRKVSDHSSQVSSPQHVQDDQGPQTFSEANAPHPFSLPTMEESEEDPEDPMEATGAIDIAQLDATREQPQVAEGLDADDLQEVSAGDIEALDEPEKTEDRISAVSAGSDDPMARTVEATISPEEDAEVKSTADANTRSQIELQSKEAPVLPPRLPTAFLVMEPLGEKEETAQEKADTADVSEKAIQASDSATTNLTEDIQSIEPPQQAEPTPEVSKIEPPAEPAPPISGTDSLQDRGLKLLRVTSSGVLRLRDPAALLGLYLSQLRQGVLTVFGDLELQPEDRFTLKLASARVVTLEAVLLARVANWFTFKIEDPSPVAELLVDTADEWRQTLNAISPEPPARAASLSGEPILAQASEPEPAPDPAHEPAHEPEPEPEQTPEAEEAPEPQAASEPAAEEVQAPSEPPAAAPTPAEDQTPRPPKLEGDRVLFERPLDLAHELEANLKNNGLFVESGPLPMMSKKRLQICVEGQLTNIVLEADVVFADGGKVGFSVPTAPDLLAQLKAIASGEAPTPAENADADSEGPTRSLTGEDTSFSGKLGNALSMRRLLDFQRKRVEAPEGLNACAALQVFEFVVRSNWKGVLTLSHNKQKFVVYFHDGSVAFIESEPFDESTALGRILVAHKKLNEGTLRQALERQRSAQRSLGKVLVGMRLVKKSDLSAALREQARQRLDLAFGWTAASFEWSPWREPPGDSDLVLTKGSRLVARHFKSRYDGLGAHEVEALFGANMGRVIAPTETLESLGPLLQLLPREARFVELQLDGSHTISDAALGSPIGRLASLRLIGVMLSMGLLVFTDGRRAVARENTSARQFSDEYVRMKREHQERAQMMREMNHFEVLGVHWSAHHRSYRAAYDKVKREFNLSRGPLKDAPPEIKSQIGEIVRIIEDAWSTLSDRAKRIGYRKKLFDETERDYAARMLVEQGEVALMRGDRVGAIESLETAVELKPSSHNKQLLLSAREGRR